MFKRFKFLFVRAAMFAASFASSSLVFVALGAAFHNVSSDAWLRDSPEARRVAARCEGYGERKARHDCVRGAVMEAQARDAGAAQLAAERSARMPS